MNELQAPEYQLPDVKIWQNQRVVTLKDIDVAHQRPNGTARRNFNKNRNRFIEGMDFFLVGADEIRTRKISEVSSKAHENMILMTESGYLMIVKSFKDDLSWHVQRQLVNSYFRQREQEIMEFTLEESPAVKVTDTPAPLLKNWYDRNKYRMEKMKDRYHVTYTHIYHKLLESVGRKYDLREAREIYRREQGEYPSYMADLFTYFPEMGAMADSLLDKVRI